MTRTLIAFLVLLSACAPATVTPQATPSATEPAASTPASTVSPTTAPTTAPAQLPQVAAPAVVVSADTFPILTSLRLKLAVIDDAVVQAARAGVEQYLRAIDLYRGGQTPALPISGRFLAAVSAALKDSATPGVTRAFALESLRVDHHVQKPWGTHAYVDVTVAIVDRVVSGTGADQHETGMLRLSGDRLRVTDGWDEANARWFNGFGPLPLEQIRTEIVPPIAEYLRGESWTRTTVPSVWTFGGDVSAFARARAQRVAAIDRTQIVSRVFEGTTATIERFDTIDGIWSGLAMVRLGGTLVTTNAAGGTDRVPFERHVRVFLFGQWVPEVVDEQAPSGVWVSGDELALDKIDLDRA
jgi:hypothetical protein